MTDEADDFTGGERQPLSVVDKIASMMDGETDDMYFIDLGYKQDDINKAKQMTGIEEDHANAPDEYMAGPETMDTINGGLNKKKRMFPKGHAGDNEMTATTGVNEADNFLNFYKTFKNI